MESLSLHKEYFDEPIVRAKADKIHFPDICPICGEPAKEISLIAVTFGTRQSYYGHLSRLSRMRFGSPINDKEARFFRVPVCTEHYVSEEEDNWGQKAFCVLFDVLGIIMVILALIVTNRDIQTGRPVASWVYAILVAFIIMIMTTRFALLLLI